MADYKIEEEILLKSAISEGIKDIMIKLLENVPETDLMRELRGEKMISHIKTIENLNDWFDTLRNKLTKSETFE